MILGCGLTRGGLLGRRRMILSRGLTRSSLLGRRGVILGCGFAGSGLFRRRWHLCGSLTGRRLGRRRVLVGNAPAHGAHLVEIAMAGDEVRGEDGSIGHVRSEQVVAEGRGIAKVDDIMIARMIMAAGGLCERSQAGGQADGEEALHGETLRVWGKAKGIYTYAARRVRVKRLLKENDCKPVSRRSGRAIRTSAVGRWGINKKEKGTTRAAIESASGHLIMRAVTRAVLVVWTALLDPEVPRVGL